MGIKLSTADQIKLLRDTAANIGERVKYLAQVDFDECLLDYAADLRVVGEIIENSSITRFPEQLEGCSKATPEESVFDGRRIWE